MGSKGTRPDDYTNIEEAKQLLADAGYPDGFDVDLSLIHIYYYTICSGIYLTAAQ